MGAFANPSTRCISESEKTGLIDVLGSRSRPIPVVEDMAYRELYFDAPYPARSLLALEDWEDYPVLYLGTFTKPLATGLKTGFVVSRDAGLLGTLARIKGHQDFGSAHFNQAIIERILREGLYSEHLEGIRRHYAAKRDRLESILVENGLREAGWTWETPGGGLLLWVRGPEGMDTRIDGSFHRACIDKEVLYVPGDLCYAEGRPWSDVRLSFGAIEAEKIPEAGRRFCEAARSAR
jgi:2-aminoadipate transaminase